MHELNPELKEEMENNHLEFITYVWLELLPKSFDEQHEKYPDSLPQLTISTLLNTEADYMIRAVDETTKKEATDLTAGDYVAIQVDDFECLYTLRDKLLPLRGQFNFWLEENKTNLLTDILTPIDTTSAYIWMPMVSRERKIGKQAGVYNAAVSILATPLDFRVYMDFGGYAKPDRSSYYEFLKSSAYQKFMESFAGKEEMKVFDIDWFCFFAGTPLPQSQWANKSTGEIAAAKKKLDDPALSIPITWNRMLHGYIMNKNSISKCGITFEWIEQRLRWVIQFYQEYKIFEKTYNAIERI
jgi:hypothetical protein